MRISDWSSDVCSSDLGAAPGRLARPAAITKMPPASAVKGAVRRRRAPGAGKTDSEGRMSIQHPYLLFLGAAPDQPAAKTAQAIATWRPAWCVGPPRLAACQAAFGLTDLTLEDAARGRAV